MRKMKFKNLFIITLMICSVFLIPSFSVKTADVTITDETKDVSSIDYLLKNAFLFGRFQNAVIEDDYVTVEAVNLRIIFFDPFQFFHYTTRETITFSNQYNGIIIAKHFLIGNFNVVLPINTNSIAVMNTTMGTIIVELYEDKMPITSANFIKLANDGFYNGLVFHRVIDDFVIQGGGYYPNGTQKISPYGPIDLEINPDVHFLDGTIGMARTSDPNSATSQFFIDDGAQPHLDYNSSNPNPNGYAAFGRVVVGIDVVRAIAAVDTKTKYFMRDWPVNDIIIDSIIIISP
ncbi:Cyclophilin type peptidyl-prolyl cis-trans isomerase/CLD [uncultured archaeon]|nr:Cyclophilin type peptidyl-prolyl cis-trans isomerase/CLD [uncultured archaeon]